MAGSLTGPALSRLRRRYRHQLKGLLWEYIPRIKCANLSGATRERLSDAGMLDYIRRFPAMWLILGLVAWTSTRLVR